ncbi:MAG: DUF1572 domain-containing protein [Xanthomarina gelatinilytica]|uniref:DUF1572 domain-containing protein n=1 Tax=Xanthomarina gelatinilytica TaxID=1137281 RepID=UPI003A882D0C
MSSSKLLAIRFREVLLNGKWIANTNYKQALSGTTVKQATTKIGFLNTLLALAYHINYYIEGLIPVFHGGDLKIKDAYSFDHPKITTQEEWDDLLNNMWQNAERFANHIDQLSETDLESPFVKEQYGTYKRNI